MLEMGLEQARMPIPKAASPRVGGVPRKGELCEGQVTFVVPLTRRRSHSSVALVLLVVYVVAVVGVPPERKESGERSALLPTESGVVGCALVLPRMTAGASPCGLEGHAERYSGRREAEAAKAAVEREAPAHTPASAMDKPPDGCLRFVSIASGVHLRVSGICVDVGWRARCPG